MMTMTEKYKVLGQYIKDSSSETPDIETYLFVKEVISRYKLGIDITSKALKNKMVEVTTKFVFQDKEDNKRKAYTWLDDSAKKSADICGCFEISL